MKPIRIRGALCAAFLASCVACALVRRTEPAGDLDADATTTTVRGSGLYAVHCAVCHGVAGRGDGTAAEFLFPPARDFANGFRLASTENGVASREDLVATLARGMPGSAMPAWEWLGRRDLEQLADHVRSLAVAARAEELLLAARGDDHPTEAEALAHAARELTPGPPLAPVDADPALVDAERGRVLYADLCLACHGADGSGDPVPLLDEERVLTWARDFTSGFMKGGATDEALAARIRIGLPGSAMPATRLDGADLASLVAHVRSLIPEGSEYRLVHRRRHVRVQRVEPPLPRDPRDAAWRDAEEILVTLSPLWWNDDAVLHASVSALHDGERFAVRIRWPDATGGGRELLAAPLPDAVALQFSEDTAPPLFGMGSHADPTTLWHWRSHRSTDAAGLLDLLEDPPHAGTDAGYSLLEGVGGLSARVDRIDATGVGSTAERERLATDVEIQAAWTGGEWEVLFLRDLDTDGFAPRPGANVQVSFAVWNGNLGDAGAQKSISIWHELEFDR